MFVGKSGRGPVNLGRSCALALFLAPLLTPPPATCQVFEVASIKPTAPNSPGPDFQNKGGRISATGISVKLLLLLAYGIRRDQISGGPNWIEWDRFDINAKADGNMDRIPEDQLRPMLQDLLRDRFRLVVKTEYKASALYALVLAKGGRKFQPSTASSKGGRFLNGPTGARFTLIKADMDSLARRLSSVVERPVVNKTGLAGEYDVTLEWAHDSTSSTLDRSLPSIFTAIQEQLGLRLEAQKGDIELLIIESIEKPRDN
jgi:uncharacterized protein (TIGR03435 family)